MYGGSQMFAHVAGPVACNDSYFTAAFGPDYVVEPHIDSIWVQDTTHAVDVSRCHFESAPRGMSAIFGPGHASDATLTDVLFNGGTNNGTVFGGTGLTLTGCRWKRYDDGQAGGFSAYSGVDAAVAIRTHVSYGSPSKSDCAFIEKQSDGSWADGSAV
jgi:hypothetical protein